MFKINYTHTLSHSFVVSLPSHFYILLSSHFFALNNKVDTDKYKIYAKHSIYSTI
ncbi:unnamed protein product [Schistosoma mansoni]|uniref:Smp_204560 n=1 Tax=Schistosoma mansoni TaxID=6183 RepID=UPI00022C8155|nr:unnamed protein product [Schistosoma mansoni]|eukprot:XP_018646314.1 unnamed protein product [Schistosoma mansoni]